ncbi:MAG TPA: BTAD domain-containing putative transcriptional regulator [Candidatus Acidoferrales bacterium]|nr:BTAD domain-containing putative transcriptional regulator [Candidatus Acidoferrales bacterium]
MEQIAVSRRLMADVLAQFHMQQARNERDDALVAELSTLLAARRESPVLHVSCFGTFRLAGEGGWETGPQPKRGRELMQYLALYPARSVARERLSELFWPELDAEAVAHRLHIAASGARTFLRELLHGFDAIRCTPEGYAWHPAVHVVTDVARFSDLYRDGSPAALEDAATLYSGELFEGESGDWLQPARVKYATMHTSIVGRLADDAFARGDYDRALGHGLELLGIDRAHEGASRLVMRCFGALGRRARALAEFEALRAYLKRHLGVEPMAETTRLIDRILREENLAAG